jgi:hypothetical protein
MKAMQGQRPSSRVARRLVRAGGAGIAGLVLAGLAWLALTLPPRSAPAPDGPVPALRTPQARGVIHVHTSRSDGSGSMDEVALAASRAGLDFVVFTDHGNGMAVHPPTYRAGVLCIDGAEISTTQGHLVALGLPPAPYPLAGEAHDVAQDIHRLGGVAFAAHPTSPRDGLAWKDWSVNLDGFEWLNADSEWRDDTRLVLARTLAHYLVRGPESIAALMTRPAALLAQWDRDSLAGRYLTTYVAADAHARLGADEDPESQLTGTDTEPSRWTLRVPSYDTMFKVLSVRAELRHPFTGRADTDAAAVVDAVRAGRLYSVIDGFARGGLLEFHGERSDGPPVQMGEQVGPGRLTRLVVRARAPVTTTLRVLRNGRLLAETSGVSLEVGPSDLGRFEPGARANAYRVEAVLGARPQAGAAPWMVSNPIFETTVDPPAEQQAAPSASNAAPGPPLASEPLAETGEWVVEKDGLSRGDLERLDGQGPARLDFALGPGRGSRWVAVAIPLGGATAERLSASGTLRFHLRAAAPMRVSLQLRTASESADLRWVRSVYVDATPREVVIPVSSLRPVGPAAGATTPRAASTVLVVVDQTNTLPGTHGSLWIERATAAWLR